MVFTRQIDGGGNGGEGAEGVCLGLLFSSWKWE